jgi:hypothetical protein
MPTSVIANSGLVFAGKISREDDVKCVIRKIGREERYEDRDLVKWFPRSPIGWFVCRSSRNFDFKEVEPSLVAIEPLNVDPPTNAELEHMILMQKTIEKLHKDEELSEEEQKLIKEAEQEKARRASNIQPFMVDDAMVANIENGGNAQNTAPNNSAYNQSKYNAFMTSSSPRNVNAAYDLRNYYHPYGDYQPPQTNGMLTQQQQGQMMDEQMQQVYYQQQMQNQQFMQQQQNQMMGQMGVPPMTTGPF